MRLLLWGMVSLCAAQDTGESSLGPVLVEPIFEPAEGVPHPQRPPALPPPQPPRLTEPLAEEARVLRELLRPGTLLLALVLAGLGAGIRVLALRLARIMRDAGYDLDKRLIGLRIVGTLTAAVCLSGWVSRWLLEQMPLLGTALAGVFLASAAVLLARQTAAAVSGAMLVLDARLREGDRVTLGTLSGTVEHVGLLRLRLRGSDGSTVYLPSHQLAASAVVVSSPSRRQSVRLRLAVPQRPDPAELERLRQRAVLCPFRFAGTVVRVEQPDDGDGLTIEVTLQSWSAAAAQEAEHWLRRSLA